MRFSAPKDTAILRRAAMGPAAMADRSKRIAQINLGLPQKSFVSAETMRRGGSFGYMGRYRDDGDFNTLGCCAGMQSNLGSLSVPKVIRVGPIAARMIELRTKGIPDKVALLDAMATLARQGEEVITADHHLQLAAGLQPLNRRGFAGLLGSLGLAPVIGAGVTGGSVGASAIGTAAAGAIGIGGGIALGQTVIPIPVVGAVIGAAIFEAVHLMQRHVGSAEASWTSPGFYASLSRLNGRDYDEKQFSEAFKGMMDTGNNIVPGCGPDRHKNPDCLLGPMAGVIAQGYLSGAVPLSATTQQVFNTAVLPWLQSGAGGLVNWANLAKEPIQQRMMMAATDRYLAGQAMTRGDMPSYGNAGAHTPSLVQALQPILQQPTTSTPGSGSPVYPTAPPPTAAQPTYNYPPGGVAPIDTGGGGMTAPPLPVPGGGTPYYSPPTGGGPAVGAPPLLPPVSGPAVMPINTASIGGGLPTWAVLAIAAVGVGFLFFKQGPVTSPPKV